MLQLASCNKYPMTQAALQFYVLDSDSVEEIQEDWINKMFEASGGAAGSSSDSSDEKPRKSKKGKKAHGKKKNPKAHYIVIMIIIICNPNLYMPPCRLLARKTRMSRRPRRHFGSLIIFPVILSEPAPK